MLREIFRFDKWRNSMSIRMISFLKSHCGDALRFMIATYGTIRDIAFNANVLLTNTSLPLSHYISV